MADNGQSTDERREGADRRHALIDVRQVAVTLAERTLAEQRAALEDRLLALVQRRGVSAKHLEALLAEFRALEAQEAILGGERRALSDRRASPGRRQSDRADC